MQIHLKSVNFSVFKSSRSHVSVSLFHLGVVGCVYSSLRSLVNLVDKTKCIQRSRHCSVFLADVTRNNTFTQGKFMEKITTSGRGSVNMSTIMKDSSHVLRLDEYDCIGFDLDNTLCEYNIHPSIEMEYNALASFLVNVKGYDGKYLLEPLDEISIDFMQKGLIIDFDHGNILKISKNGTILKASHGTRFLTEKEIVQYYGTDRKWVITSDFCSNMLVAYNGPLSERMRALLDYFDMPASLAFARIIDTLDEKLGKPADIYKVWPDVLTGLHSMYSRDNFLSNEGGYFQQLKSNPQNYIKLCDPDVLNWLRKIKSYKTTFLITGSNCDFATFIAENCLGKDWRTFFDIVVCYARKPGFFTGGRPFIELDNFQETDPVERNGLKLGHVYNQGNWQELYELFRETVGNKEPKCLYFGDNLVQDIYAPSEFTKCETVAVVQEQGISSSNDGVNSRMSSTGSLTELLSKKVLSSKSWGSYFFDENMQQSTLWDDVIRTHAKMCIPNLSVLAQHPINHEFSSFFKCTRSSNGYFPISPDGLPK